MNKKEIDGSAKIIWDYMLMHHQLKKADCIFVLGSNDVRVADYAIELFENGYAPHIIFSGGYGRNTKGIFNKTEAEVFAQRAREHGIAEATITVENKSTNTGENVLFTKKLLEQKGFDFSTFILVQKPYMERRTYATFKALWSEKGCIVTSPQLSFDEYPTADIPKEFVINMLVGDLQRIKEYPYKGWQISQEIPMDVWGAYKELIVLGFTKQLLGGISGLGKGAWRGIDTDAYLKQLKEEWRK